jgi:acetyltransferase-like isoleucine patch superfamily enzyme
MPITRSHAFAEGTTLPAPERLTYLPSDHPHQNLAKDLWEVFRATTDISDLALLGTDAWPINLTGDRSAITIGSDTVVRGVIRVERNGHVRIADHCYIGDDVILSAHTGIDIEADVLIAHGCQIFDNTTHPTDAVGRAEHYRAILTEKPFSKPIPTSPIIIERGAWISMNSIIMRGVRLGSRSIVAAGSVVVKDVPPETMVGGNPARVIKDPTSWESKRTDQ